MIFINETMGEGYIVDLTNKVRSLVGHFRKESTWLGIIKED